jgi:hypothetical protein
MTSYKGVRVLDDFNDVDFLLWKPLALGHFETYHPETAALVQKYAAEIEADIVRGSGNDAAVEAAARAPAARCDQLAKGHIMLLLGPTIQSRLLHFSGRKELWDELDEQFRLWEDCQGPVWQREWRQLGPLPLEGVVAYSRRAEAPAVKLGRAGRPVPEMSLVGDVLDGLLRERPEWQGYLSGVKGAMLSARGGALKVLRPHLGDLEDRNAELAPARAPVLAPSPMAHAAATEMAAEARISCLEEALQIIPSARDERFASSAELGLGHVPTHRGSTSTASPEKLHYEMVSVLQSGPGAICLTQHMPTPSVAFDLVIPSSWTTTWCAQSCWRCITTCHPGHKPYLAARSIATDVCVAQKLLQCLLPDFVSVASSQAGMPIPYPQRYHLQLLARRANCIIARCPPKEIAVPPDLASHVLVRVLPALEDGGAVSR